MKEPYHCQDEVRRRTVENTPTVNGVDYLEVLDLDAPAGSPRQQTLLVWCFHPLPTGGDALSAANVRIEGGVRVRNIGVVWAVRAADAQQLIDKGLLNNPISSADERDFYLAQHDPDRLLVIRTDAAGDFSTYHLELAASPTSGHPPAGFDPQVSCLDFSFKVDCPSEFDCEPDFQCPPEEAEEPPIHYLAKDYTSFRTLMLDRMSVTMPDWQERNPADIGVTVVEALAHAADHLSYFQDAVATEAYLGTARRRASVRRHARILDYTMHDGCNARTWVAFTVDIAGDGALLEKKDITGNITRLLTENAASTVIGPEDWLEVQEAYQPVIFELMHDITLREAHIRIPIHTWGDQSCCLPEGSTEAALVDTNPRSLALAPGDVIIFEEMIGPETALKADADPTHRHAVRLTDVREDVDDLENVNVLRIYWDVQDALPFDLCISKIIENKLYREISLALGNVALADHGRTITGERLPQPYGHLAYRPRLKRKQITYSNQALESIEIEAPASRTLEQEPHTALPCAALFRGEETWFPMRDLLNASRTTEGFVVEMENDGDAVIRFGDNIYGKSPSFDEDSGPLEATYRIGSGNTGNIGGGALAHVVTKISGITSVRNPLPALGGREPESLEEVRQYAPQAFRTQERAVTEADYAEVTERHLEVQKARATRRWTGSWYTIFITVDRIGGKPVTREFEAEIRAHLEKYRMAGVDVEVDAPRFVPLEIALTICVKEGYFRSDVKEVLLEVFTRGTRPDGKPGFFHPDRFTFGQPLYLSELIATVMDVDGVKWVDIDPTPPKQNRFKRWGETPKQEIARGYIRPGRLEILRLDNDPNQPENGKLTFFMIGGM